MNPAKLDDVARKAGVSKSTASLALRGIGRMSKATRERVRQFAKELNYHPDPLVSQFQAAVRARRTPKFEGVIAWINDYGPDYFKHPWRSRVWEGAVERAEERGFKLEMFPLGCTPKSEPVGELDALARMFRARGVVGLLLGDLRLSWALRRSWTGLPVVTLCDQEPVGPPMKRQPWHLIHPLVEPDHYRNMLNCLRHLFELGYRRPGLVTSTYLQGVAQEAATAAFQRFASHLSRPQPALFFTPETAKRGADLEQQSVAAIGRWLDRQRPDAIVATSYYVLRWLEVLGKEVPQQIGLAHCASGGREIDEGWAGIKVDWKHLAAVAVDQLVGRIQAGDTLTPSRPMRLLIEGEWHVGWTVCQPAVLPPRRGKHSSIS